VKGDTGSTQRDTSPIPPALPLRSPWHLSPPPSPPAFQTPKLCHPVTTSPAVKSLSSTHDSLRFHAGSQCQDQLVIQHSPKPSPNTHIELICETSRPPSSITHTTGTPLYIPLLPLPTHPPLFPLPPFPLPSCYPSPPTPLPPPPNHTKPTCDHHFRPKGPQQCPPLQAHAGRHGQDQLVAARSSNKGEANAGVAAGRLNKGGHAWH